MKSRKKSGVNRQSSLENIKNGDGRVIMPGMLNKDIFSLTPNETPK